MLTKIKVNESLIHSLNDIDSKHKQPLMEYVTSMEMFQDTFDIDSCGSQENKLSLDHQQINKHQSEKQTKSSDDETNEPQEIKDSNV